MPAAPPVAYATLSQPLPSSQYILDIKPSATNPHLFLRHPSTDITIADNQSLQAVETFAGGHTGHISDLAVDGDNVWTSGKDATLVQWDERSRRPAQQIKAFVRKPLPVLAVASLSGDHLVVGGTELVSSEAHILFWDTRNAKQPLYSHTSTHSDDITHLSFLPPTSTYLASSSSNPLPPRLLLSSSTDGLVALSNPQESDEEEAVLAAENWGQSIARVGTYAHKGKMRVWARSDMDGVAMWDIGKGEEDDLELQNLVEHPTETFREKTFAPPTNAASVSRTAEEERGDKSGRITANYLIDVVPSLGISKQQTPMVALGSNEGDIVLLHQSKEFEPSAYFLSGPGPSRGHKDVVRALYHDVANEAIYTGSEDGVLSGWSLASLPSRLLVGDPDIDDDGGDGREAADSDDEDEESEIETEDEEMDVDESEDEERQPGPRNGPILGGGREEGRKQKRREKRPQPY